MWIEEESCIAIIAEHSTKSLEHRPRQKTNQTKIVTTQKIDYPELIDGQTGTTAISPLLTIETKIRDISAEIAIYKAKVEVELTVGVERTDQG